MSASLAETLYHAWRRAQMDPTTSPAWGNLDADTRAAWGCVAESATLMLTDPEHATEACREKFDVANADPDRVAELAEHVATAGFGWPTLVEPTLTFAGVTTKALAAELAERKAKAHEPKYCPGCGRDINPLNQHERDSSQTCICSGLDVCECGHERDDHPRGICWVTECGCGRFALKARAE